MKQTEINLQMTSFLVVLRMEDDLKRTRKTTCKLLMIQIWNENVEWLNYAEMQYLEIIFCSYLNYLLACYTTHNLIYNHLYYIN